MMLMVFFEKLRDAGNALDLSKLKGYVFRKWVFRLVLLLLVALALLGVVLQGPRSLTLPSLYVECPKESVVRCENPVYHNVEYCGKALSESDPLCVLEFLVPGTSLGVKLNFIIANFVLLTLALVVLGFVLNHFLYNKDFGLWKRIVKEFGRL